MQDGDSPSVQTTVLHKPHIGGSLKLIDSLNKILFHGNYLKTLNSLPSAWLIKSRSGAKTDEDRFHSVKQFRHPGM